MKTRMELWKEYRDDIAKNISLQKAVMKSNEKLKILYNRLLAVFPEYEDKYKSKLSQFEASVKKIEQAPELPKDKLTDILDKINTMESKENSSFKSIDELTFSTGELDNVIQAIQMGKLKKDKYIGGASDDISMGETKMVTIKKNPNMLRIAIDGPSGSGKSSVAKAIADKFGLNYINTGLVYRAIAFFFISKNIDFNDTEKMIELLDRIEINLLPDEKVELNKSILKNELRSDEVSQNASKVAAISEIRKFAVEVQIKSGGKAGVIMDGRDTTFKIMPDADLKIFLDTDPEVRAKRRVEQNRKLGFSVDYDQILNEIKTRDHRDRNRETDPLHKTEDAFLIDASNLSLDEVIMEVEKLINSL